MAGRFPAAIIVALVCLAVVGCSDRDGSSDSATREVPQAAATATAIAPSPVSARVEGPAEFEGSRAMEHIERLSVDIGPRVAGSPGEQQAIDYIAGQLRSFGYTVEVQPFEYVGDRFQAGEVAANGQSFEAYTMRGSAGGEATGEAVYVGIADAGDIAGRDLTGKVAIASRGTIPFAEKLANVENAGAVALVVINSQEGAFIGDLGQATDLPVVSVANEAGQALRDAAAAGSEVKVRAAGSRATSWNVLARASEDASCEVLVGGHHDSVPGAPGALDNASGAATVLELARAFAADGLDDGLCFATFGAEESGLFGSRAMADRMQSEGTLPRTMVNLDMTGLGDSIDLIGSPELVQIADRLAEEAGIDANPTELEAFLGSDHQSFQVVGVPVIFLTTDDFGQFHTPGDTIATIDPADLERAGDLAYALITELLR